MMWVLAFSLVLGFDHSGDLVLLVAFGVATIALIGRRGFPRRASALTLSWFGPLLVAAFPLVIGLVQEANLTPLSLLLAMLLVKGTFVALVCSWLFVGYGMVPIAAAATYVAPKRTPEMERFAGSLPGRLWWAVPVVILAIYLLQALALSRMVR